MTQAVTLAQLASSGALSADTSGNVGIGTTTPAASLSITKQSTALSGTGNSFGVYLYPTSTGQCWLDGVTSSSGNTLMGIRSYNNGTYYTANLSNNGNFQFNSGYGSTATAYGCRAWVNFNGTGTVAIRGSGNVTSITDNGVGDYTLNFTTAMPDTNYSFNSNMMMASNTNPVSLNTQLNTAAVGSLRITNQSNNNGSASYGNADGTFIYVAVFR